MTNQLRMAIKQAFEYLDKKGTEIPFDIWLETIKTGVFKAGGDDVTAIGAKYHDAVTATLLTYLEGGNIPVPRNQFKRAMIEAFGDAADLAWVDGGSEPPLDEDTLAWFNARVEAELGYINLLFEEAKQLRKDEEFDPLVWASARADGYTASVREVYNNVRLRAGKDMMVSFEGTDGKKDPCDTCQSLKGSRHKISWFVKRNFVPPHGSGLDCAKGGKCKHFLRSDSGERMTV